jgi:hypothetical protein
MEKDKRSLIRRINIPDTTIEIVTNQNNFFLLQKFSKKMPLYNLSKSGVCFISDKRFKKGQFLMLNINIPGEGKIKLKVDVRWVKNNYQGNKCLIGTQIRPFGNQGKYNSMSALKRLREIEHKYLSFVNGPQPAAEI